MTFTARGSRLHRPSPAMVVAVIALFVALAGTTLAATGGNFILGKSNSASTATQLSSGAGSALKLTNTAGGNGILATGGSVGENAAAVNGNSTAGNGVQGVSGKNTASGVYGQNNSTGFGVAGRSTNGTGVLGDSSAGWAFNAFGNAKQTRTGNGFVKAMARIDLNLPGSDKIRSCFNSGVAPAQATSGNCGITYTRADTGRYRINFGFQVIDRFFSVTSENCAGCILSVDAITPPDQNTIVVKAYAPNQTPSPGFSDSSFYILVY